MNFRPMQAPRVDVLRPPRDTISTRLAKLAWRYRRQLAPIAAVGALALASEIGHEASAGYAWLPAALGLAGAAAWRWLAHRPIHHWFALGAGVAGIWSGLCWLLGLGDLVAQVSLVVLGTGACVAWWTYALPRSKVVIIGGSRRPWKRREFLFRLRHGRHLRQVVKAWPEIAARARLDGTTLRRAETDIAGSVYRALLKLDVTAGVLRKQAEAVALGLEVWVMDLQIEEDASRRADLAWLIWPRLDKGPGLPSAPVEPAGEEPEQDDPRLGQLRDALDLTPRTWRELAERGGLLEEREIWHDFLPALEEEGVAENISGKWRRVLTVAKEA